ncbi:MAG: TrkA family potassium uptake protein [Spirochaetales bacterium]|nr:TrkA family potassium uptake protein [Spirochaetales bacterium]
MKQFAIIGVDTFARSLLEELISVDCEILLIDRNREVIDFYKDDVTEAYVADVMNEETINRLIPTDIDGVIIDLGSNIEAAVLVTNYVKKMGLDNVHIKVNSDRHGEILEIIGADHIIYPDREAARRLTPMLLTTTLFNFVPIGNGLVMAEVSPPDKLIENQNNDIRRTFGINIIAFRRAKGEYHFYRREHVFEKDDILLVVGSEEDIVGFTNKELIASPHRFPTLLKRLFKDQLK